MHAPGGSCPCWEDRAAVPPWWLDPNCVKHGLVSHGQHDCLNELLYLLVGTANVEVLLCQVLVDLHCLDSRVKFSGKLLEYQVQVLVCAHKVGGLQLLRVHKSRHRVSPCS
jgi:hypothetical protein